MVAEYSGNERLLTDPRRRRRRRRRRLVEAEADGGVAVNGAEVAGGEARLGHRHDRAEELEVEEELELLELEDGDELELLEEELLG